MHVSSIGHRALSRQGGLLTKVDQPSPAVELGVHCLNLMRVPAPRHGRDSFEYNYTRDLLSCIGSRAGSPAHEDGVAIVPEIEDVERDWRSVVVD